MLENKSGVIRGLMLFDGLKTFSSLFLCFSVFSSKHSLAGGGVFSKWF